MVARALRAREHGIVIGHGRDARLFVAELRRIDRAQPHHQPVGGALFDQLVGGRAAAAPGDRQAAIFDEAARIEQVVEIFARGAMAGLAPLGHRIGPRRVQRAAMPRIDLGQIGADMVEIDRLRLARRRIGDRAVGGAHEQDRLADIERIADLGGDQRDFAALRGGDAMLHLHRLDHGDFLTRRHLVARRDIERDQRAEHRRRDRDGARWRGDGRCCRLAGRGGRRRIGGQRRFGRQQFVEPFADQPNMRAARRDIGIAQQCAQETDIGRHPGNLEPCQCARRLGRRRAEPAIGHRHDQLGEQ